LKATVSRGFFASFWLFQVFTKSAKMGHFLHFVKAGNINNQSLNSVQLLASGGGVNT
jgi:hypothetical protein